MNAARATSDPSKLPCATCGSDVDPLRADRVALFGERFRYFCSVACHERYEPRVLLTPLPAPRERPSQELRAVPIEATVHVEPAELREIRRITHSEDSEPEPVASSANAELESLQGLEERGAVPGMGEGTASAIGALLLALSSIGGGLAVALSLAGNSNVAVTARLVLTAVSACALAAETFLGVREETEQSPLARLAAPVGAVLLAIFAYVSASESTNGIVTLAGLLVASSALSVLLVRRVRRPVDVERTALGAELDGTCKRVVLDEELAETRAVDLRPGEEIVLDSGDVVPVDATLTAGSAVVLPWRGASVRAERHEGDVLVAGARV
ncbi:MAG TPA: hypothetical protein VFQ61_36860, partial [Polyangiaceae bacterium]|nr:hypothetical protein [Polyangiaceae bacterium]